MSRLSHYSPEAFDPQPPPDLTELAIRREVAHYQRRLHATLGSDPDYLAWAEAYDAETAALRDDSNDPF